MRAKSIALLLVVLIAFNSYSQDDLPFQVLVAKGASIYGETIEPLQMINDVTSIEIADEGFVSLVHKGGTTYEHTETFFTFYLKPEELKNQSERPKIDLLYSDSTILDPTRLITVTYPIFDRSGYLLWDESEPFEIFWRLSNKPVIVNYILSVSDNEGNKIQDFRTKPSKYVLKPNTYGLKDGIFNMKITSTFAGETVSSKNYTVELKPGKSYLLKASDLVLKALCLEFTPDLALPVWQKALGKPNGRYYWSLFEKFLTRNKEALKANGQDIEQILSQNR